MDAVLGIKLAYRKKLSIFKFKIASGVDTLFDMLIVGRIINQSWHIYTLILITSFYCHSWDYYEVHIINEVLGPLFFYLIFDQSFQKYSQIRATKVFNFFVIQYHFDEYIILVLSCKFNEYISHTWLKLI